MKNTQLENALKNKAQSTIYMGEVRFRVPLSHFEKVEVNPGEIMIFRGDDFWTTAKNISECIMSPGFKYFKVSETGSLEMV